MYKYIEHVPRVSGCFRWVLQAATRHSAPDVLELMFSRTSVQKTSRQTQKSAQINHCS